MVAIKPFNGYRYDVEDISKVISPPYDVISKEKQKRLLEDSPYNFVRLILGNDPYVEECRRDLEMISGLLNEWIEKGILRQEDKESLYVYSQVFSVGGDQKRRTGLIALVKLENFGEKHIYPHEKVIPKHVEDRLLLMEATQANLGLIFGIYPDPSRETDRLLDEVSSDEPLFTCTLDDVLHELWKIDDDAFIGNLQKEMADKQVYIADGHHRYTTALRYRDAHPDQQSAKYVMMALVNMYNEGLTILPTHRLVRKGNHDTTTILEGIGNSFQTEPTTQDQMMEGIKGKRYAYGLYADGDFHILRLKDRRTVESLPAVSEALKQLDVTVLHELILKPLLDIDTEALDIQDKITYAKSTDAAMANLATGDYSFGFFLNAVNMEEIVRVATAHEAMPQKSTFFYPKVYSGLVTYLLE
jgi:uncharacterized protein (DUF1015 family)